MSHAFSSKWLLVTEPSPHVLHVQLNRTPVNAFSTEFWTAYGALFDRITVESPDTRAVVLSSAIPKLFTAGLDLTDSSALSTDASDAGRQALHLQNHIREFQNAIAAPSRAPYPVIVALHGLVLGLGIDIACACDIRFAASTAKFSIKEVDIGLAADIGVLALISKVSGNESLVRELAYSTRFFEAEEAHRMGFVSRVVRGSDPREAVIREALELAVVIASKSPIAVTGTKKILDHARDHSVQENLEYTAVWNGAALQTLDIAAAMKASLAKKAQPVFEPLKPKL